jgi:cell volume regulation protein A
LFAAVVSSTDATAVFSILESKKLKLKLKENTDTVLEFESATNDPVALLMVILLADIILSSSGVAPSFSSNRYVASPENSIWCLSRFYTR